MDTDTKTAETQLIADLRKQLNVAYLVKDDLWKLSRDAKAKYDSVLRAWCDAEGRVKGLEAAVKALEAR